MTVRAFSLKRRVPISIDAHPWQQLLQSFPPVLLVLGEADVNNLQLLQVAKLGDALVADIPTAEVDVLGGTCPSRDETTKVARGLIPLARNPFLVYACS